MRKTTGLISLLLLAAGLPAWAADTKPAEKQSSAKMTLQSPAFSFHLDFHDGLHAEDWQNRWTGRVLALGHGPEIEFDIGLPGKPVRT